MVLESIRRAFPYGVNTYQNRLKTPYKYTITMNKVDNMRYKKRIRTTKKPHKCGVYGYYVSFLNLCAKVIFRA